MPTKNATTSKNSAGFTKEEMAAMKDRARELKAGEDQEEALRDVLAKVAEMPEPDRTMAERIHKIVTEAAPTLAPKTYYGMPAYAKDGKVICFFKPKSKFKVRYASVEFSADAKLDDGDMWPISYSVINLTPAVESRIAELVKKSIS